MFLWLPALVVGLLAGVLLAEVDPAAAAVGAGSPARRPRRGELVSRLAGVDDAGWSVAG